MSRKSRSFWRRNKKIMILLMLLLLLIAAGLTGVGLLGKREDRIRTAGYEDEPITRLSIELDGVPYYLRDGITGYLLMGTDETTETLRQEENGTNNRQADFLMLLVLDRGRKTCQAIHINRDTLMEIRTLGENGNPNGVVTRQITLAYSYGSGGRDSCRNTTEAVSRLLCGMPVEHFFALTMDGIPVISDLAGGVPVTITDDMTSANPDYKKGNTVILRGQEALSFVRMRMSVTHGTNTERMARQRAFITSLVERLQTKMEADAEFSIRLVEAVSPYMTSDLITAELSDLVQQLKDYEFLPIIVLPGELEKNYETGYIEFYPDYDEVKKMLVDLFFSPDLC